MLQAVVPRVMRLAARTTPQLLASSPVTAAAASGLVYGLLRGRQTDIAASSVNFPS